MKALVLKSRWGDDEPWLVWFLDDVWAFEAFEEALDKANREVTSYLAKQHLRSVGYAYL